MTKVREPNFDLLRILSALAVIILHVSGGFLKYDEMKVPTNCNISVLLLNHIVRFAVPCFFMLSGAFILDNERNADYKYFYKKAFKNIGVTCVVFCLLYTFYSVAKLMLSVFIFNKHDFNYFMNELLAVMKNLVAGQPAGHLWYLFTLAGLYFASPFVIRLAADLRRGGGKFIW